MSLTFRSTAHSEIGLVRKNNQDSAYVSPTMLMVADGMGGAAAGDLASAVAIDELRDSDADFRESDMLEVAAAAIGRANERIRELVALDPSLDGMGTTVCGLLFDGERLAVANIGDSRGYRLRDGHFERITRDHSWVQTLVDDGRITEAEALVHPHRSLILKVLNGQPTHTPDLEMADVQAGDRYLICSDGLCGMVTDAAIGEVIGGDDPEQVVDSLVKIAYAEGGLDNITIILADVVDDGPAGETMVLGAAAEIDLDVAADDIDDTRQIPTGPRPDPGAREKAELARYLPFLTTTKVLMAAVRKGVGREEAHEAIKEHAVAVALDLRKGARVNDLLDRLAADSRLGLTREQLEATQADPLELTGAARDQVDDVADKVKRIAKKYPAAAGYTPGSVL